MEIYVFLFISSLIYKVSLLSRGANQLLQQYNGFWITGKILHHSKIEIVHYFYLNGFGFLICYLVTKRLNMLRVANWF